MSFILCFLRSKMACSKIGRLTTGTIGLGTLRVRGRRRVPNPPAMMIAFKFYTSKCLGGVKKQVTIF